MSNKRIYGVIDWLDDMYTREERIALVYEAVPDCVTVDGFITAEVAEEDEPFKLPDERETFVNDLTAFGLMDDIIEYWTSKAFNTHPLINDFNYVQADVDAWNWFTYAITHEQFKGIEFVKPTKDTVA